MTETEWLGADDGPIKMLHFLEESKSSQRKLRLFAVACCRRVWHLLTEDRSRRAIELSERYADGLATEPELFNARDEAYDFNLLPWPGRIP